MYRSPQQRFRRSLRLVGVGVLVFALLTPIESAQASAVQTQQQPKFTAAAAFDVSAPLREVAPRTAMTTSTAKPTSDEIRDDRGPTVADHGYSGDGALQAGGSAVGTAGGAAVQAKDAPPVIPGTEANFEGLSNQDNFNMFGFRVNPPDPVGAVGPNHYVEMVNLAFAVYSKTGAKLLGPVNTGSLWAGFAINECTDPSGDPIVVYDQRADRWILTQFTTRGLNYPNEPLNQFYNCVAISTTGDPTGSYYRYAFTTGYNFPDYPKYGVWGDSYLITTREFGVADPSLYGIGVYGLERDKMIEGDPGARAVSVLLQEGPVPLNLIGDGLLPPDMDGKKPPKKNTPAPIIGTQDDNASYGATFDALNIWEFNVAWDDTPTASIALKTQLPVAGFDSVFPCGPTARDCLPQPGITNRGQYLDVLSYRQRPTFRLAYRNTGSHESMVTSQSVEALPGVAGMRWYEVRREDGEYKVYQQGTYAPNDGVHRWMGSIAQDKKGNMGLGYSVVNGTDVYPGIRYTGRLARDPLGQMTLGEAVLVNGSGVQRTLNSRWGDYTSMNVDPVDDCTFWYVNEYYTAAGQASATNGWQTRIGSFRLPEC